VPFQLVPANPFEECRKSALQESLAFAGLEKALTTQGVVAVRTRLVVDELKWHPMGCGPNPAGIMLKDALL
jgi:hypothetical protein